MRALSLPILSTTAPGFARAFDRVLARALTDAGRVEKEVREIMAAVRREGDRALVRFTRRFDGGNITPADGARGAPDTPAGSDPHARNRGGPDRALP